MAPACRQRAAGRFVPPALSSRSGQGPAASAGPSRVALTAPPSSLKKVTPLPSQSASRFVERLKADVGSHEARMQSVRENEVDFLRLGDEAVTLHSKQEDMTSRAGFLHGKSSHLLAELKDFEAQINAKFDRLEKCNAEGQVRLNRSNPASIAGGNRRIDTPNENKLRS